MYDSGAGSRAGELVSHPKSTVTEYTSMRSSHGMSLQTLETVKARLCDERCSLGSWEAVASKNGVSVGTVCRVSSGYAPRKAHIRLALGLPALAPAPVCPRHRVVHQSKRCPKPTFEENCDAYDAWLAANAGRMDEMVKWAERKRNG